MSYVTRAYMGALLVGGLAPLVGAFVVQRRQALIGDGLGHLAFASAAGAALLAVSPIPLTLGVTIAGATLLEWLQRFARARADVALSVIYYAGIAAGVVMLSTTRSFASSALTLLFGSLLTVTAADLLLIAAVLGASAFVVLAGYRTFFLLVLDEKAAAVAGVPVGLTATLLSALVAAVIVAGIRAVGVLLIAALLVIPAAAAQRVARSLKGSLILGSVFGASGGIAGVWLAIRLDWPPGATIALLAILLYLAIAIAMPVRSRLGGRRRIPSRGG